MEYVAAIFGAVIDHAPYLVGFALPPIVEFLNRDIKRDKERYLVAILVCFFTAILLHWNEVVRGKPEEVVVVAGLIFMESNTVFKLYFSKSWIREVIQKNNPPTSVEEPEGLGSVESLPINP